MRKIVTQKSPPPCACMFFCCLSQCFPHAQLAKKAQLGARHWAGLEFLYRRAQCCCQSRSHTGGQLAWSGCASMAQTHRRPFLPIRASSWCSKVFLATKLDTPALALLGQGSGFLVEFWLIYWNFWWNSAAARNSARISGEIGGPKILGFTHEICFFSRWPALCQS